MGRGHVFTLLARDIHITVKSVCRAIAAQLQHMHTHYICMYAQDKTSHWQVSEFT